MNKIVKQMIDQSKDQYDPTLNIDGYSTELVYTVIDTVCEIMEEENSEEGYYMRQVLENKLCFSNE
jgi:hypothetical protein